MKRIFASLAVILLSLCVVRAQTVVCDSLDTQKDYASSPALLLDGKVPGLRVSSIDGNQLGALEVYVRGVNTIHSDSQPLWIVDGAPLANGMNSSGEAFWQYGDNAYTTALNPMAFLGLGEIESIEVIRNLSQAAKYGVRGANGVIVVKTRCGADSGNTVHLNSSVGVNVPYMSENGLNMGINQNYNISLGGREGISRYNISASLRQIGGVLPADNNTYGMLKMDVVSLSNSLFDFGTHAIFSMGQTNTAASVRKIGGESLTLAIRSHILSPSTDIALWDAGYDDTTNDYRAVLSSYFDINFNPYLKLHSSFGADLQNIVRMQWYGMETAFGKAFNGAAADAKSLIFSYDASTELQFRRYFATDHLVEASAGFSYLGEKNKLNNISGTDFPSHELRARGISLMESEKKIRKFFQSWNHYAFSASASYTYRELAGLDASLVAGNSRKYYDDVTLYPSVNVFFEGASLLKDFTDIFSSLRLEAGYGIAGHEKYVPYELTGNYLSGFWPEVPFGAEPFYDGLYSLRSREWNVSLSVSAFNSRLNAKAGYFDKTTCDDYTIFSFGVLKDAFWKWAERSVAYTRNALIANRGYEFEISCTPVKTRNAHWNIDANLTAVDNRATRIDMDDRTGLDVGRNLIGSYNVCGYPVSSFVGYVNHPDGSYLDMNGDWRLSESDKVVLGSPVPRFTVGFGTSLGLGPVIFDMRMTGAAGFNIYDLNSMILDGVKEICSSYLRKGDYLRLSKVSLSYRMPQFVSWLRNVDINLSAHNLWSTSCSGLWNPDVSVYGKHAGTLGYDYGSYPAFRTFTLGLNLTF